MFQFIVTYFIQLKVLFFNYFDSNFIKEYFFELLIIFILFFLIIIIFFFLINTINPIHSLLCMLLIFFYW